MKPLKKLLALLLIAVFMVTPATTLAEPGLSHDTPTEAFPCAESELPSVQEGIPDEDNSDVIADAPDAIPAELETFELESDACIGADTPSETVPALGDALTKTDADSDRPAPESVIAAPEDGNALAAPLFEADDGSAEETDAIEVFDPIPLGVGETYAIPTRAGAKYSTSSKKTATVSKAGVVKGKKKGPVAITVETEDGAQVYSFLVVAAPKKVKLSTSKLTLGLDETGDAAQALTASLSPAGCRQGVRFKSSKAIVATINEDGFVTPLKLGKTTITASTYNKKSAKCVVTVRAAAEAVQLDRAEIYLNEKRTLKLKPTVLPGGAKAQFTYISSDPSVASVNRDGVVSAVSVGDAEITVETYNHHSTTCTIHVRRAPTGIQLSQSTGKLAVSMSIQLGHTLRPVDDALVNPTVTWSSSSKKVAVVDQSGIVTGKKAGTATITAKTSNGKKATCRIKVVAAPKSIAVRTSKALLGVDETTKVLAAFSKKSWSPVEWHVEGDAIELDVATGTVTARSVGRAVIIATALYGTGGTPLTASCEIEVRPAPATLSIDGENDLLVLKKGKSLTLPVLLPDGTAAALTYDTSSKAIATVSASGVVKAKKPGVVRITVSTHTGVSTEVRLVVPGKPDKSSLPATVYVTPYGEKYHRESCPSTVHSRLTALSLSEAVAKGYEPCKNCKP